MEQVKLRVEGHDFWGWTAVSVQAGIERAARSFSVQARLKQPLEGPFREVCPGLACEVFIWDEEDGWETKVVTGWLEDLDIGGDADNISVRLQGRSRSCDAVDSNILPGWGALRGQPLIKIAETLVEPWGLKVYGIDAGDTVRKFAPESTDTVLQALETLADEHGVLLFDDEEGDLWLVRGGSWDRSLGTITRGPGGNVISGNVRYSTRNRFTYYVCRGQIAGSDNVFGEAAAHPSATVEDSELVVGRTRIMVLDAERGADSERCQRRAEYEASRREGQSITGTYQVRRWKAPDGELWRPGTEIPVRDPLTGLFRVMLIEEVEFIIGATQRPETKLSIIDPRAHEVLEPLKRTKRKGKRKTKGFLQQFGEAFVDAGAKVPEAQGSKGLWAELDKVGKQAPASSSTSAVSYSQIPEGA